MLEHPFFFFLSVDTFVGICFDFPQVTLGNRKRLSNIDIQQMNLLYKCSGGGGGGGGGGEPNPPPPTWPPTGLMK